MKRGFTLIELMIVVAIIAFLAMVSIPSFKRFLAKAKRTEAYMNLNALATAEKVYWAEHGVYVPDLKAIGWKPEGQVQYTYGFPGSEGTNYITGSLNTPASHLGIGSAGKDAFVIVAAGDIDSDGQPDIITINQDMKIDIVKDDLEE
jgi:prepilin-type N-terminal cleavage/methylation domain-containing protein